VGFARFHCSALTPRPRINLLLYYGVLGARSAWRSRLERVDPLVPPPAPDTRTTARPRTNWPWAELMQRTSGSTSWRVLAVRGRLELVAVIEDPRVIRRILNHLGLPTEVPAARPARSPPLPLGQSAPWHGEGAVP